MHLHCDFQYESLMQLLDWFLPALGTCKTKLQFLWSATGWFLKFVGRAMSTKDHKKWFVCNKFLHSGKFAIQFMQKDASCNRNAKWLPTGGHDLQVKAKLFFSWQVPRWNTLNIIQVTSDLYKQHLFNYLWLVFSKKNICTVVYSSYSPGLSWSIWQVTWSWMRFLLTQFVLRKWVCLQHSRHLAFEEEILVFLGPSTTPVPILKVHHSISLSLKQSMLQMARSRPTNNFQIDCYP